jgi:hypothetical protein
MIDNHVSIPLGKGTVIGIVDAINSDGDMEVLVDGMVLLCNVSDVNGVPITHQRLLEMGLDNWMGSNYGLFMGDIVFNVYYVTNKSTWMAQICDKVLDKDINFGSVKYIHEIQNICLVVFGERLN